MVMSKFDSDGFQVVKSKRISRKKQAKLPQNHRNEYLEYDTDIETAKKRILNCIDELRVSPFLHQVFESVSTALQTRSVVEIVSFGLGHVAECITARFQLGLLLLLQEKFTPRVVSAHDPVFSSVDCALLKALDVQVISQNTEAHHPVTECENSVTLAFLPHCPKQLTNNFLWTNWGLELQQCILICNSFTSLIENQPSRELQKVVPYVFNLAPHTKEILLINDFKYTDIFNDTSVHYFSTEELNKVGPEFWVKGDKPSYEDLGEEFISSLVVQELKL